MCDNVWLKYLTKCMEEGSGSGVRPAMLSFFMKEGIAGRTLSFWGQRQVQFISILYYLYFNLYGYVCIVNLVVRWRRSGAQKCAEVSNCRIGEVARTRTGVRVQSV